MQALFDQRRRGQIRHAISTGNQLELRGRFRDAAADDTIELSEKDLEVEAERAGHPHSGYYFRFIGSTNDGKVEIVISDGHRELFSGAVASTGQSTAVMRCGRSLTFAVSGHSASVISIDE